MEVITAIISYFTVLKCIWSKEQSLVPSPSGAEDPCCMGAALQSRQPAMTGAWHVAGHLPVKKGRLLGTYGVIVPCGFSTVSAAGVVWALCQINMAFVEFLAENMFLMSRWYMWVVEDMQALLVHWTALSSPTHTSGAWSQETHWWDHTIALVWRNSSKGEPGCRWGGRPLRCLEPKIFGWIWKLNFLMALMFSEGPYTEITTNFTISKGVWDCVPWSLL